MMARTHIFVGTCSVLILAAEWGTHISPGCAAAAVVGSLAPDIDMPRSLIGRAFPMFSSLLLKCFGHRTLTHSLVGLGIVFMVSSGVERLQSFAGVSFFIAYASHVAADMLTVGGCALFYPVSKRRYAFYFPVTTGSDFEFAWAACLVAFFGVLTHFLHPPPVGLGG